MKPQERSSLGLFCECIERYIIRTDHPSKYFEHIQNHLKDYILDGFFYSRFIKIMLIII